MTTTTTTTTTTPKVIIFCKESEENAMTKVSTSLANNFSVTNVSFRSTSIPASRLLSTVTSSSNNSIFVVIGSNDSIVNCIENESVSPVLSFSSSEEEEEETEKMALLIAKVCACSSPTVASSVSSYIASKKQSSLIRDAQSHTKSPYYQSQISHVYDAKLQITGDNITFSSSSSKNAPVRISGKVRDRFDLGDKLALVTTDRQSGFDRMLALVPFKGQVLNLTSAYWFEMTEHIIPNHIVSVPHGNVSVVKKCTPFPIEFVVRAYVTGSTSTSIWKNYQNGVRNYCGHDLPEGLQKNQKLWKLLLTPTTKEEEHDRPISPADIVSEGWMTQEDFDICAKAALDVFAFGQKVALERGLILVDTKYEMGKDEETGTIMMIDEMHTPDSSRYWLAHSYEERISRGMEPENIDKEFLRLWFRDNCDPYHDEVLPEAPKELVEELSRRYVSLYEMITWKEFEFDVEAEGHIGEAIQRSV